MTPEAQPPEWVDLAADIRRIDGAHDMGAGALAEALTEAGWTRAVPAGLDAAWAEAEAALPEGGWITVGTVGPGLVTVEVMHWPDGERNRSIARAFKMPMLDAVRSVRDQLLAARLTAEKGKSA